ncbi:sister chromatid cohesion 1 protein 4 isoform X3 [Manihot esculenta]|nr:sister chromatid cohesion 1 protein 4 isoform X3 [Manihot esculenta]
MDGVVYSSSQFGLDERFGDGDASQVGLDLEEDLFLDKVAATGSGEVSENDASMPVEPIPHPKIDTSHEGMTESSEDIPLNGTREKMEGFSANLGGVDYAQAPSTPGLMEEPNVFSVKEGLVCEDHLEPEDQNLSECVRIGASENVATSDIHHRDDAMDFSLGGHFNSNSSVCMHAEDSSHPSGELEVNQTRMEGDSLSTKVIAEYDPVDGNVGVLDGFNKVEDANKVVLCNNEEPVPSIDGSGECDKSLGVRLRETDDVEITRNMEELHSNGKPFVSNPIHSRESPSAPNSVNIEGQGCQGLEEVMNDNVNNEPIATACTSVLRTCSSRLSEPDIASHDVGNSMVASDLQSVDTVPLSTELLEREEGFHASGTSTKVQVQECHKTDVVRSEENRISEATLSGEILADGGTQEDQLDKAISNDNQCEDLNSSLTSDLPAPEKLLFAPQRPLDRPHDLLVETPDKQVQEEGDESGAGTKISVRKRSLTESSLTVQSVNSVESFSMTKSTRTLDSIPDDDDLLSSILVGRRSSALKMKPTPPVPEVPPMKRARSSSRPSTLKRKVLMDDSMVLHGDTIRQQLTNTEDIRRMRKKAPCTCTEILMIQRQFLEEGIFSEPVLTGMLAELSDLHSEAFDLSRITVSENDDNNNASFEALDDEDSAKQNVNQHSGIEGSTEPGSCRNDLDGQFSETPIQNDNQQVEDHFGSYDIGNQEHVNFITDAADYRTSEHEHLGKISEMEIDKLDAEVADATNHSAQGFETPQREPLSGDIFEMTTGTLDQSDVMDKMIGSDDFMQMDASNMPSDKIDTQLVEEVASLRDMSKGRELDGIEFVDHSVGQIIANGTELRTEGIPLEENKAGVPTEVRDFHPEGCAPIDDNFSSVNVDQAMDEIGNDKHGVLCEIGGLVVSSGLIDDKDQVSNPDQISNPLCNEESKMDSVHLVGLGGDFKSTSMNGDTACEQAERQSIMDTENTQLDCVTTGDCGDFQDDAFANNTEFLNVDDDEIGEDYEEGMPNAEDTRVLDNSGWSSRTRAVAKYLQTLFDKEAGHGRKVLPMDSLLAGKTRKEASRMFFETLVLKTRDYVHVEQAKPFDNINIKPRAKLMKSDF